MKLTETFTLDDLHLLNMTDIKKYRTELLEETDWWANSDITMTEEQRAYRQALRDVPQQDGFPVDITWPTKP